MKKFALSTTFAVAFLLAACGDDIENNTINQMGMDIVTDEDDLPECTEKNEGEQALVKGETSVRVCVDGEWVAMKDDFSCKTVELKDKSGYKIVCNGDSIGVVLNGSDGKDGKDAEVAKPDTAVNDSEKIAISLDSLVGVTQKGPFLKGSTVYLYELSDGRTLKQTNGNFTSNITSNDGRYKFTARDLVSQYAMVVVDGYYRNEVTGLTSEAPIRLKAITDMRKRSSVNVNILTHLEFDRVYNLVTRGDKDGKKLTVKQAKRQAQKEILKLFDIELDDNTDAEDMDVFGKTDADAALLAISVLLQGDRTESDMMALLAEISNAIADKGEWNDAVTKEEIALWAAIADGKGRLDSAYNHVKGWGLGGGNVPPFEKFVRNFYGVETGLGQCGNKKISVGTRKSLKTGSDSLSFVCDDAEKGWWRLLTRLDVDTLGWGTDFEEGDVRNGQVDTGLTYVFENGAWRHGTSLDSTLGLSCIPARKDTLLKASVVDYYKCVSDTVVSFEGLNWHSVWRKATNDELDMDYWERNKNEDGLLLKSSFTGRTRVWDADSLREPTLAEQDWNRACVSYMYADAEDGFVIDTLYNGLAYTCSDTGWSKTGTFKDRRNAKIYKGVTIGTQTWMAQNLNFTDSSSYPGMKGRWSCYDNEPENCIKYGRFYTWAATMDSAGYWSTNGMGCGFEQSCKPTYPVRGICPEGWHLPSRDEWGILVREVGGWNVAGKMLRSQTEWSNWTSDGTDPYAFSILPYGNSFWSSSQNGYYYAYKMISGIDGAEMASVAKSARHAVRCVKD